MILDAFTGPEVEVLYATKESDVVQSLEELAQHVEAPETIAPALARLVQRGVLQPIDYENGFIGYYFPDTDFAQAVYDEIYGPPQEVHT